MVVDLWRDPTTHAVLTVYLMDGLQDKHRTTQIQNNSQRSHVLLRKTTARPRDANRGALPGTPGRNLNLNNYGHWMYVFLVCYSTVYFSVHNKSTCLSPLFINGLFGCYIHLNLLLHILTFSDVEISELVWLLNVVVYSAAKIEQVSFYNACYFSLNKKEGFWFKIRYGYG